MNRTQNLSTPARPVFDRLQPYRSLIIVAGLALLAHVAIFVNLPLSWQSAAVLLLTGFLPGLLFVDWLLGGHARPLPEPWERSLYAVAAGYGVMVTVLLLLSYLPGGLAWWQTLLAFDAVLLFLLVLLWRRRFAALTSNMAEAQHRMGADCSVSLTSRDTRHSREGGNPRDPNLNHTRMAASSKQSKGWADILPDAQRGWLIAALLSIVLAGGFLRFNDLAYTEFQGDESRAVLRAAETIQGYHDALLNHKKGPVEILIPTGAYSLLDRLNEAAARLPFAVANVAGLLAVFLLGWRLYHPVAGWAAAMLLALDGYFIGFARIVQYQSIVFLTVVLVILILYRLVRSPHSLSRYLTLASLLLATGLLAHYEAALVALPAAYLLYALWRRGVGLARLARALIGPVLAGGALLAAFYVPFVLNPSFGVTYAYITVNRIGTTFPYNNLVDVFQRTTLYSSVYYVALLVACALISLIGIYRRNLPRTLGWIVAAPLTLGMVLTFWQPAWLTVGGRDHTWVFFAAAVLIAWFLPNFPLEQRVAWIWFGGTAIFMLFFTLTPNTHVYGFFIPWVLVAGDVIGRGWRSLAARLGTRAAQWIAVPIAALVMLLFGNYAYWYFAATDVEVLRTWRDSRPRGYPVTYDMPTRMSIFGYPLRNGWKVIGALYADGVLDAPFDLHGKEPVADWYTRGTGQCLRDHVYYLWHESVEPADLGYNTVVREQIEDQGYQLFGTVLVNEQPRMRIYKIDDEPVTPQTFRIEDYEDRFDNELSGPIFEKNGPSAAPDIQHEFYLRFGEAIQLLGYSLDRTEVVPGEGVLLTLYWQADQAVDVDYSVFTQIIDMTDNHKAGQRDGEPVCNNLPTSRWLTGDTIIDRYYIPIFPNAPPGPYTLLVGMYGGDSGERLDIFGTDIAPIGDAAGLAEISVLPAP